jgi:hypothetical protein
VNDKIEFAVKLAEVKTATLKYFEHAAKSNYNFLSSQLIILYISI